MGFVVPAAIGAEIAHRALRPLVLVGDGAFQMTGVELSTALRQGLRPVVLVLNNGGYGTERHLLDGPFNDLIGLGGHRSRRDAASRFQKRPGLPHSRRSRPETTRGKAQEEAGQRFSWWKEGFSANGGFCK